VASYGNIDVSFFFGFERSGTKLMHECGYLVLQDSLGEEGNGKGGEKKRFKKQHTHLVTLRNFGLHTLSLTFQ